jgi:hypothetical protein
MDMKIIILICIGIAAALFIIKKIKKSFTKAECDSCCSSCKINCKKIVKNRN